MVQWLTSYKIEPISNLKSPVNHHCCITGSIISPKHCMIHRRITIACITGQSSLYSITSSIISPQSTAWFTSVSPLYHRWIIIVVSPVVSYHQSTAWFTSVSPFYHRWIIVVYYNCFYKRGSFSNKCHLHFLINATPTEQSCSSFLLRFQVYLKQVEHKLMHMWVILDRFKCKAYRADLNVFWY